MKAIVHHELQQTMTIHSTLPSLPEQRPTSSCRCGRSFVFSFCNDEDDVFVVGKAGVMGNFRRNNREINRSRNLMS